MLYLLQENHETKKQNRMSLLLGGILLVLGVAGLFPVSGSNMTWYLDLPSAFGSGLYLYGTDALFRKKDKKRSHTFSTKDRTPGWHMRKSDGGGLRCRKRAEHSFTGS